jgi:two-component system response regulator HydG
MTLESSDPSTFLPMEEVERRYIGQVLDALGGNKASAARVLGMDRRTLYRKLERWAHDAAPAPDDASRRLAGPERGRHDAAC